MALSLFDDKSNPPQENDLSIALGDNYALWNELKEAISSSYAPLASDWVFAHRWGLRLKHKKRAVLYMTPCRGYFLASFALGGRAVQAAHQSDLPAAILRVIDDAPQYAEGSGVRVEVKDAADLRSVRTLAAIKMAN